jgi:hypothetical protein
VVGYYNANWANDLEDKRSTIGFVFMIKCGAIFKNNKQQPTIALSIIEPEYMASTQARRKPYG